jgi:trehalose 6-phosphate synthase/phosphatase
MLNLNGGPTPGGRVLLVSNRLPLTLRLESNRPTIVRSSGGLATALSSVHDEMESLWIGSVGALDALRGTARAEVERTMEEMRVVAVQPDPTDAEIFYSRLSNGILWPLFHDRLDHLPRDLGGWDAYERVNQAFADRVAEVWRPGDVIWVHDYHLMRLPALLRRELPDARIGFFLHVPFPNPELFLVLPARRLLMEGLLGADVVGFHTRRHRGHFTAVLRRLFGIEMNAQQSVDYGGRAVSLGVFPIGIDATALAQQARGPAVSRKMTDLHTREALVVGIDRLDYTKGLVRRLGAIERFLVRWPNWSGKIRFLQVAVPSRGEVAAYRRHRAEVERLVTRINGRFGTPSWTPIQFLHRNLPMDEVLALYRAADVMLVTPLRDGMNLVAKEFVAAQTDADGVLILSEFAGASEQLTQALLVNPYDLDAVAERIYEALTMEPAERAQRMRALRQNVIEQDVHWWADNFLAALAAPIDAREVVTSAQQPVERP